ncbi:MAG: hypothetical protein ACM31C_11690 [Acidobacteriota bacterium]
MLLRRVAWIALVPAVALAAPKGRRPKTTPKPAETTPKPADTTPKPDDKAASGSDAGAGSGAAAAAPSPAPATPAGDTAGAPSKPDDKAAPKEDMDVDSLRQEYLSLRDELFKSRARANAVASALYSTRMSIKLAWDSGRYYGVSKASIRLDGATVYEDDKGAIAADDGVRFDGYVAPGRHVVTFHIDAAGKDDDSFTSSTETQVVVKAVANKDLVVAAKARDGGDISYEWKKAEHGKYGLGIDINVKAVAREAAKK